jgi:hypothetical protein
MSSVFIIGASSDIGISLSIAYAKKGYNLILAGRNLKNIRKIGDDLAIKYPIEIQCVQLDIIDTNSHRDILKSIKSIPPITICLAGYLGDQEKGFLDWNESKKIIETNFSGVVSLLNLLSFHYKNQGNGTIAVFSSVAGERGRQSNFLYGSAKAGLTAYLSGLRNYLHTFGVHVITIKPGFMQTKMTEHLDLPKLLTAQPDFVASKTISAIEKRKNIVYIKSTWRLIMIVIRNITESIFKKLKL